MSFGTSRKSALHLELRAVEGPGDGRPDARTFVLLPTLEELLSEPDFGHREPIRLPGHVRPLDGWAVFGTVRARGVVLH
jgi:hypothetical protein